MSKIKSFRGKIVDNGQDTIILHTNNGSTGYRIKKLQLMIEQLGSADCEHIVKVYSVKQPDNIPAGTNLYSKVDFSDNTLLAAAQSSSGSNARIYPEDHHVVFDNMTFNQDIFITHADNEGSASVNYYIELEMFKLDLNENTVATLKDIRNETLAL